MIRRFRYLLLGIVFLSAFLELHGQVHLSLGSDSVCGPDSVSIAVTATGFTDINAFSIVFDLDTTVLHFDTIVNVHPSLENPGFPPFPPLFLGSGFYPLDTMPTAFWVSLVPASIPPGDTLFELTFKLVSGSTNIGVDNLYTDILDNNGDTVATSFSGGTVFVATPPLIVSMPRVTPSCLDDTAHFNIITNPPSSSYYWEIRPLGGPPNWSAIPPSLSSGSDSMDLAIWYQPAGAYQLRCIFSDFCADTSMPRNYFINPNPTVTASPDTTIYAGYPAYLGASGGFSYSWSNGNTSANDTVFPASTTTYHVTGTDLNGCEDLDSVTVTVRDLPLTSMTLGHESGCADTVLIPVIASGLDSVGAISILFSYDTNEIAFPFVPPDINSIFAQNNLPAVAALFGSVNNGIVNIQWTTLGSAVSINSDTILVMKAISSGGQSSLVWDTINSETGPGGMINYQLALTDGSVTVHPLPASPTLTGDSICRGSAASLAATGPGSMQWSEISNPGITVHTGPTYQPQGLSAGIDSFLVTQTDTNGCESLPDTVTLLVRANPNADAGNAQAIPFGTSANLDGSASTGAAPLTYQWSPPALVSSPNAAITQTDPLSSTSTFALLVTDSAGCTDIDSVQVNITGGPLVIDTIYASPVAACPGDSISLELVVSGGQVPYAYQWSPPGLFSDPTVEDPQMAADSSLWVYVMVTDSTPLLASDSIYIRIYELPEDFSLQGDTARCPGGPGVPIWLEESLDSVRYDLYHDGILVNSLAGSNDSLGFGIYADSGYYTVYATDTVTGCGHWLSDSVEIEVLPAPTAVISPSADTGICLGEVMTYSAATGSGWTYNWWRLPNDSLGAGSFWNASPIAGSYQYYVVVTNQEGCTDTSQLVNLDVNNPPIAQITAPAELCENSSILVSSLSSAGTGTLSQQWSGPASAFLGTLFTPTPVFSGATAGTYELYLTITDSLNCSDQDTLTITVNPTPQLNAGPDTTVNYGTVVDLYSNATPAANLAYTWTPAGLLNNANVPAPQTQALTSTSTYIVYVYDTTTICSASDTFTIVVQGGPLQIDSITLSSDTACPNDTVTLAAVVSGGSGQYSYQWGSGAIPPDDSIVQMVAPPSGGAVNYSLTVTDTVTGDTDIRTAFFQVHEQPEAIFPSESVCQGDSIYLSAIITDSTSGPYAYLWTGPGASSNTGNPWSIPNAATSMAGSYTMILTDGNGCTDVHTNNVIVRDTPQVVVTALDSLICPGQQTLVEANVINSSIASYSWNTTPPQFGSNAIVQPSDTTTYTVTATINGCTASAGITINTLPGVVSYIDTSFCEGDSIFINGQWYSQGGLYSDSSTTAAGCDSIITIDITVHPLPYDLKTIPIDSAVISCYDMAGNAIDGSGNNHHGILNGPLPANDRFSQPGSALLFDGNNDEVEIAHHPDFDFGSNDFTLVAWIYPTAFTGNMGLNALITKHTGDPGSWLFRVASDPASGGNYKLNFETNSPVMRYYGNNTISLNTWQMAAITRSGNNYTFYYNGSPDGSFTDTKFFNTQEPVRFSAQGNVTNERFTGTMDDIRIFSKALSPQEIQTVYNTASACNGLDTNYLSLEIPDDSLCEYEDAIVRLINSQAGVEYMLYDTAGAFSTTQYGNGDTLSFTVPAFSHGGSYQIMATDTTTACTRLLDTTFSFTILPTPIASISGDTLICQGSSVSLTASGGSQYFWNTTPQQSTAFITVTPAGTSTYSVTVSQDGCMDSTAHTVNIIPSVFTNYFDTVCDGDTLWFNGNSYTQGGSFNDTLVSASGCDSIVTIHLTIYPLPWAILPAIPSVSNCTDSLVDSRDGKIYPTTLIGNQCWMAANLDYGSFINSSTPMSNNGIAEKYCYANNTSYCNAYGGLYQWNELMQYATIPGIQGLCPQGWHIPTDGEWITLEGNVDNTFGPGNPIWTNPGWRGNDAGLQLRSQNGWPPGNTATNPHGFTALPGGYMNSSGNFNNSFSAAYFWTSSGSAPTSTAFQRILNFSRTDVYRSQESYSAGLSVRCVKDTLINPPGAIQIEHSDSVCEYETAWVHILSSQPGVAYYIYDTNTPSAFSATGFGNGDTLSFTIPAYTPAASYRILATDTASNCERLLDTLIEITVLPTPLISITNDTAICNGSSINLQAGGGQSYEWNTVPPAFTSSVSVSPVNQTTYSVTVTQDGCVDSADVTVNVLPVFYDTVTAVICEGDTFSYQGWDYTQQGIYMDTLATAAGCDSIITINLTVNPSPLGLASVTTNWSCGMPITDSRDGQVYNTVQIGNQCWFAENLNIGDTVVSIFTGSSHSNSSFNGVIEKYCMNNDPANCSIYGGLYEWTEAMNYNFQEGSQGICPSGWLIPTDNDWKILEGNADSQYGVGNAIWNQSGYRGLDAGNNLKEAGTAHWNTANGTNSTGFTALPGAQRIWDGGFGNLGQGGYFWSSTQGGAGEAFVRILYTDLGTVRREDHTFEMGHSIRCLKDTSLQNVLEIELSDSICEYDDALVLLHNSQQDIAYTLYDTATNTSYSSPQYGTGGTLSFTVPAFSHSGDFEILAVDTTSGCDRVLDTVINFMVLPTPIITLTPDTSICSGDSITLTAAGGQQYLWNTQPQAGSASIGVSPGGLTAYTVTVTQDGCSNTDSVIVDVLPVFYDTVSEVICEGDTFNFLGRDYTQQGLFNDTLATMAGCDSIITIDLAVNPLPWGLNSTPNIQIEHPDSVCEYEIAEVMLINSEPGISYLLVDTGFFQPVSTPQFGNGDTLVFPVNSTFQGASLVFFAENPTTGCMRILDTSLTIVFKPAPVTDIIPGDTSICAGESVTLTATGGSSYLWTTGNPTATITVSPASTTEYFVFVEENGCNATDSVTITVIPLPVTSTSGDTSICAGDSIVISASGGSQYQWAPAASLDDPGVPDPTAFPAASTSYFVTVTEQGCHAMDSLDIIVNPLPVITISPDTSICAGDIADLLATGGSSYQWSSGQSGGSISVQPNSTTTYTVTVSTAAGCSATEDVLVDVLPLPTVDAGPNQLINYGTTTTLNGTAGGSGGPYTYQWAPAGLLNNPNAAQPQTIALTASTTFYLTVTDQNSGCSNMDSVEILISGSPMQIDTILATPPAICPGDSSLLSVIVSGGTGEYAYRWDTVGGGIAGTDSSIQLSPGLTTGFRCIVYDSISYDTAFVDLIVHNPAVATVSGDTTVCPGSIVTLNAGGGILYQWDSLPASASGMVNWTANAAGPVVVQVTDSNGCSDTASVMISLLPEPQIQVIISSTVCEGNMLLLLSDISVGGGTVPPYSTIWTGPSGFTANIFDTIIPAAQLNMEGMYYFSLTDGNGCTVVDSGYTQVFPAPLVGMTPLPADVCEKDTAILISATPWPGGFFSGTGVQSNFNGTATFDPSLAGAGGPYGVTYTYTDSNSCSSDTTSYIIVNPEPDALINGLQTSYCEHDPVDTLYGVPSNGGIFSGPGITNISPGVALFDPQAAGSGTGLNIGYSYLDIHGCGDDTLVQTDVIANPVVTTSGDSSICAGDSLQLNATGGTTYLWTPPAGLSSTTIPDPVASPAATTQYFVEVSANGCSTRDSLTVTVLPLPPADAGQDTSYCEGDSVLLTGSGGTSYTWSNGANTPSTYVSPLVAQYLYLTVSDGNCQAIDSVLVTPIPIPVAEAGNDTTICASDSIQLQASGGSAYSWGPVSGLSNANIADPMASPSVTTQYHVTVSEQGCSAADSVLITVIPLPLITTSGDTIVCYGDTASLNASGGSSYSWSPVSPLGTADSSATLAWPLTTTTFTVTVTDNGCSDTEDVLVQVNPLPPAYAGADTSVCDGDSVLLTATGGNTYLWSTGQTGASIYVSPADTAEYFVTVSDQLCSATDSVMVDWKPIPVAEAGTDTAVCLNDSVQLSASGGNAYLWSPSASLSQANIADPNASPASPTYYFLTVTTDGCSSADSVFVDVYPLPLAEAGSDTSICLGDSAYLSASGGNTYLWSTTPSVSTANVAVGPSVTTTYYVTVSDGTCDAVDSVTVTVDPPPQVILSADTSICEGDSAFLTAAGGNTYLWSTTPSSSSNSIGVGPATSTWYYVTVSNGSCDAVDSVFVEVIPLPNASAGADTSVCLGDSVQLQASGGTQYLWSPGASLSSTTIANPVAFPAATQWYQLTVTEQGCSAIDSVRVEVIPLPQADAGNDTLICPGDTAWLQGSGGSTYLWEPAALLSDPAIANPYTVLSSTTTFYLTVTENTCDASDSVRVEMHPLPVLSVSPPSADICEGGSATLQASGGQNYLWTPATGLSSTTAANVIASPAATTTYTLSGENSFGCVDSIQVDVVVHENPDIVATLEDPVICRGEYVEIEASGASSYFWYPSSGLSSDTSALVIASPVWTTTYFVLGYSEYGCADTLDIEITVLDRINLDLGPNRHYCTGDELILQAGSDTSITYIEWQDGSGTPFYSVTEAGTYWVYVDNGECPESDTVILFPCTELWVPNSFTPNNDGLNEFFEPKASTLLYQYHIWIFNRWGEVVFESMDINQPWDGTYKGSDAPIGVYSYVIEYTGQADVAIYRSQRRVGSMVLLR